MKVVFFADTLTSHQLGLCNAFFEKDNSFRFVSFTELPEYRKSFGFKEFKDVPYFLCAKDIDIEKIYDETDVAIVGAAPSEVIHKLLSKGKKVFLFSERFYKKGTWHRFIPRTLKSVKARYENNDNFAALCASSFLPYDLKISGYKGKCYQWGYFPELVQINPTEVIKNKKPYSILWAARFIDWKHPEYMIELAEFLEKNNSEYNITMIGDGVLREGIEKQAKEKKLNITFIGKLKPKEVKKYMLDSKIFILSSDQNEGWGVVVNEALSCACVTIASTFAGASKYLLENGKAGLTYKTKAELFNLVLENIDGNDELALKGCEFVNREYSPKNAVDKFYKLLNGEIAENGVCSNATYS